MLEKWFFVASKNLKDVTDLPIPKRYTKLKSIIMALYPNERISVLSMLEPSCPS
jgi:hypothetical protein